MGNHLKDQTSPYLLQHVENPVDWYPWGDEAFDKARVEDKPIFLSVGYSTCHWCHVMAEESFEDEEIADILNKNYVCIKVDREERPDIDSVYMTVCQMLTGSGGWPMSVFMTADRMPFFAGTYFPKTTSRGSIGFNELLSLISEKWVNERESLLASSQGIIEQLKKKEKKSTLGNTDLPDSAYSVFRRRYDKRFGGFGNAPKFPAAQNLVFLMTYYKRRGDEASLKMAENTLVQMYRGGLFDHIGFGFCRYSTDAYFLAPHFEKMLYDNALLIQAYCMAYEITKNALYLTVAEKTAKYVLREMTSPDGAFYSAQDADSEGEEGGFYLFTPSEIAGIIGEKNASLFNRYYDISEQGNFNGRNIPNLLKTDQPFDAFDDYLTPIYEYRKKRRRLQTDDKILTSWNSLMIAALCSLYRVSHNRDYIQAAKKAFDFIERNLYSDGFLYVSWREGKHSKNGFLDDYAACIYALIALYRSTFEQRFIDRAMQLKEYASQEFFDEEEGGFFLYGKMHEKMVLRPKESYDGAMPSGNSLMAYNLVQLRFLRDDEETERIIEKHLEYMRAEAQDYPAGYSFLMKTLLDISDPPEMVSVVKADCEELEDLQFKGGLDSMVKIIKKETKEYPLVNQNTTFYICKGNRCLPPLNSWD